MKKLSTLTLLTTAATSCLTHADDKIAIQYMQYQESDDRIGVNYLAAAFEKDFGVDYTLKVDYSYDSISGASPSWDAVSGGSPSVDLDDPVNDITDQAILSGGGQQEDYVWRNIEMTDRRDSGGAQLTWRHGERRNELTVGANISAESDYESLELSSSYLAYLDELKNTSLSVGASYQGNEVNTIDNGWKDITIINTQVGITHILNHQTLLKADLFAFQDKGELSNPYQRIVRQYNGQYYLAKDSRPERRQAAGFKLGHIYAFNDHLILHSDYRFYQDDWGINSHTLTANAYITINEHWRIAPGLRYYQQSAADFYKAHDGSDPYFEITGYGSSDQRLSDFDSWTGQFGITYLHQSDLEFNLTTTAQQQSYGLDLYWAMLGMVYKY